MAEIGIVTKTIEDEVIVKLKRTEACGSCNACSNGSDKDMFIQAKNHCLANVGQWVEIHLDERSFIQAVGIMYGIPLIGLLTGVFLGFGLGRLFFETMTDLLSIGLGFLLAGACFVIINKNVKRFNTNKFKARAIRIVEHENKD